MTKRQGMFKYFPIDLGSESPKVILSGMGRSGTTLIGNILNVNNRFRIMFEPFFPKKVNDAKNFEYIQYLRKEDSNPLLTKQGKKILSGGVKSNWIDRDNSKLVYTSRIIKDIRCNLMLAWLKRISGNPPVVLAVRHPLQVCASWKKLGWGKEVATERSDTEIILSQSQLLEDFPLIQQVLEKIDLNDYVQNVIFQWCVYHIVPFAQLKKGDAHVLFYENLVVKPEEELNSLSLYLNENFQVEAVKDILSKSSSTNFRQRDFSKDNTITSWRNELLPSEIDKAFEVLSFFKLNTLYNDEGLPVKRPLQEIKKVGV